MKNFIKLLVIILLTINSSNFLVYADLEDTNEFKRFIVTAYYSPLPDQTFYLKGSYEADIILNGKGIRGASGKGVYPGMLAAPKTYSFGTKIYLKGAGVGTVDDRGGAIVGSGSRGYDCDRIDIWMGYGDDGLKKALTWGKREVYGKVLQDDEIQNYPVIETGLNKMRPVSKPDYIPDSITKNSSINDVKKVQEILKNISFYNGEIDGKYSRLLIDAIADFQINNNLIKSSFSLDAGFFGPKTKESLRKNYNKYLSLTEERKKQDMIRQKEIAQLDKKVQNIISQLGNPKTGEIGVHVRKLQKTLKLLGYFDSKDTAIFGAQTQESVINYQLKKGIIHSKEDLGAGKIDENTKKVLEDDLRGYMSLGNEINI